MTNDLVTSYTFTVTATELTTGEPAFVVTCAELPAFITQGLTVDGALQNALDLLREWRQDWPDVPLADEAVSGGSAGDWRWSNA